MEDNQQPSLSIGDIEGVVRVIDAAVARGAIRGDEMVAVGTLRQRFYDFAQNARSHQESSGDETEEQASE